MAVLLPPTALAPPAFSACRALIVDPLAPSRRLLRDMLGMAGIGRTEACEAADATAMLAEGPWNLLFVDWSRQCDAIALLNVLRRDGHPHRFLPVVVVSGYAGAQHVARARDAGASEFLLKPYSIDVVRSRLLSVARQPRLFIETDDFFGPDRRRSRIPFGGDERRLHQNWRAADRRRGDGAWGGLERRQSRPTYMPVERRGASR